MPHVPPGSGGGQRIGPEYSALAPAASPASVAVVGSNVGGFSVSESDSATRAEMVAAMRPLRFSDPVGNMLVDLPLLSLVLSPARPSLSAAAGEGGDLSRPLSTSASSSMRQPLMAAGSMPADAPLSGTSVSSWRPGMSASSWGTSTNRRSTSCPGSSASSSCVAASDPLLDVKVQMRASQLLTSCAAQAAFRNGAPKAIDPAKGCECAICQEPVDTTQDKHLTMQTLPCSHAFHKECFEQYAASRKEMFPRAPVACPICRCPAVVTDDSSTSRRGSGRRTRSTAAVAAPRTPTGGRRGPGGSGRAGNNSASPARTPRASSTGRVQSSPTAATTVRRRGTPSSGRRQRSPRANTGTAVTATSRGSEGSNASIGGERSPGIGGDGVVSDVGD
eukprot:TRINITY_DN49437_c0_g1_i1.p1 TRINITY_DN49437_c0_g1~~TRINITY_DN49437_c0_g1_i1.p1  ORF type:complete len:391 (+),score=68.96 TRINITY_DN49437_c0_g1_i1:80-1252(+)